MAVDPAPSRVAGGARRSRPWSMGVLVLVHSAIRPLEHLIEGVSVVPLGQTDAQADPEALEVSCIVPIVELVLLESRIRSSAGCDSVPLFENELLYTPVQQLAHIELIVRRTCNFVNPSELLELFARFP
jgi:hypothetical protein